MAAAGFPYAQRAAVAAVILGVVHAGLAAGCLGPHDRVKLDTDYEKIETQSQLLQASDMQYGPVDTSELCARLARGYCATCHVSNDKALTAQHTRYASYLGSNSSLVCAEQDRVAGK